MEVTLIINEEYGIMIAAILSAVMIGGEKSGWSKQVQDDCATNFRRIYKTLTIEQKTALRKEMEVAQNASEEQLKEKIRNFLNTLD